MLLKLQIATEAIDFYAIFFYAYKRIKLIQIECENLLCELKYFNRSDF